MKIFGFITLLIMTSSPALAASSSVAKVLMDFVMTFNSLAYKNGDKYKILHKHKGDVKPQEGIRCH